MDLEISWRLILTNPTVKHYFVYTYVHTYKMLHFERGSIITMRVN